MGISTLSRSSSSERPRACCEEEAFYSHYDWCLNPILSLGQLLLLVHEVEPGEKRWLHLDARVRALLPFRFPARLLRRRMTLPAAFRNQDLTHHDVSALARRVAASLGGGAGGADAAQPLVVVGPRTAGAYFAPLLKTHLAACGVVGTSWLTIRPKQRPSAAEHRRLRQLRRSTARVVVVDEPPSSGETLRLTLAILARAGVSADRVTVAVPRNPSKADWTLPAEYAELPRPALIAVDPPDYYKARLLEPRAIGSLLREYCGPNAAVAETADVAALNAHLWAHHRDGFHVRPK